MAKSKTNKTNTNIQTQEVDVLYQRMGAKWYAFSLVNDEVFVGEVDSEALADIPEEKVINLNAKRTPKLGNVA